MTMMMKLLEKKEEEGGIKNFWWYCQYERSTSRMERGKGGDE